MKTVSPEHFQGKNAAEHLKEARKRGALASAEIHGAEMPGHFAAAADACKETAVALLLLFGVCTGFKLPIERVFLFLLIFSGGWLIWKTGRSALLGWARMERLHRVIEEERWEIEHHRSQEREELTELYQAKGFSGKLLEDVIDVMMADDNRLLRIMLEEELGLTLEAYEHPLKQSAGAAIGVLISASTVLLATFFFPSYGIIGACSIMIIVAALLTTKLERSRRLNQVVWNLAVAFFAFGIIYFVTYING
jgi:hypothetical protein